MNFLAIDFGTKNIGLAWAQEGIDVVLPFGIIKNSDKTSDDLPNLIKKEKIDKVIIGLPTGLDGSETVNTARVREFARILEDAIGFKIEFVNEMFSSQMADRSGAEGASRDEKSAMTILRSYLDSFKK
ncbi:MAG: Holliday junction resolvase RuvX [Patescibacteria group bacterium]